MKSKVCYIICSHLLIGIFLFTGAFAKPVVTKSASSPLGVQEALFPLDNDNSSDLQYASIGFSSIEFQQYRGAGPQECKYEKVSHYFLGTFVLPLLLDSVLSAVFFSWTYGVEIIFGTTDIIYPFHYFW